MSDEAWHCKQIPNGDNPLVVCERESLLAEIDRLRALDSVGDRKDATTTEDFAALLPADVSVSITTHVRRDTRPSIRWTAIGWDETAIDTYGNAWSMAEAIAAMLELLPDPSPLGVLQGQEQSARASTEKDTQP